MENFLFDKSLQVYNGARRVVGRRWISPSRFDFSVPDEKLNRMLRLFEEEAEARLSLPFGFKFRTKWIHSSSGKAHSTALESALAAELIAFYDTGLAREILSPFLDNQALEGNIPMEIQPFSSSRYSAGPSLFNALWKIGRMDGKLQDADKLCDRMSRLADWLVMHKKNVEGLFVHEDARWFGTDLYLDELRQAHKHLGNVRDNVRSVAFNSLIAMQMRVMADIARFASRDSEADRFDEIANELSERMKEVFWDEESGVFHDLVDESVTREITLAGFFPLVAEVASKNQAARMVEWLGFVSDKVAMMSARPLTAPLFRLMVMGLSKYGFARETSRASLDVADAAAALTQSDRYFLPRVVALLLLVGEVIGFNRYHDRYIIYPKLPEKWTGLPVRVSDGYNNLKIILTLKKGDRIDCRIYGTPGQVHESTIHNFKHASIKLPLI